MKSIVVALLTVGIICIANAADDHQGPTADAGSQQKIDQSKAPAPEAKELQTTGDATVGDPHLGGGGYGYGSRTVYHKSYAGGFGGFGHHHGGGGVYHSHYSHSAGHHGGGFLRATQDQQQQAQGQQAIVQSPYGYPSAPSIPCPQNLVVQCTPSVTPVVCSGGY